MMTSLITYSAQLGTTSTLASIQGLFAGIYFGLGELLKMLIFTSITKYLSMKYCLNKVVERAALLAASLSELTDNG